MTARKTLSNPTPISYFIQKKVIDIVRTQLWGERGSAKCVQMRARGGGICFEYARISALKTSSILGCFDGR